MSGSDNLLGPGDFSPPDPEELPDIYLERAAERLGKSTEDQEVVDLAWELYEQDKKQAEYDRGEDAYYDAEDRKNGLY